jgi:hypothetical protein
LKGLAVQFCCPLGGLGLPRLSGEAAGLSGLVVMGLA